MQLVADDPFHRARVAVHRRALKSLHLYASWPGRRGLRGDGQQQHHPPDTMSHREAQRVLVSGYVAPVVVTKAAARAMARAAPRIPSRRLLKKDTARSVP